MTKLCASWIFAAAATAIIVGVLLDPSLPVGLIHNGMYKIG